jgi:hypothetical protein
VNDSFARDVVDTVLMGTAAPHIPAVPYIAIIGAAVMLALAATDIASRAALKPVAVRIVDK